MPVTVTTTAPLLANGVYSSGWQQLDPDQPYCSLSLKTDQAGTLSVWEQGQPNQAAILVASIPIAAGSGPIALTVQIRQQHWWLMYANGSVDQSTFSLSYLVGPGTNDILEPQLSWLILKELRAQSLLLQTLREPTSTQVNIPYGTDYRLPL